MVILTYPNKNLLSYALYEEPYRRDHVNYVIQQPHLNQLTEHDKKILFTIIRISGVDNPETFWEQLISSLNVYKYPEDCTVQQKRARHGLIELTMCKEYNAIVLSLYNSRRR